MPPPPPATDLRFALRLLRRTRRFSLAALLSLAVGTGLGIAGGSLVALGLAEPAPTEGREGIAVPAEDGAGSARRPDPGALGELLGQSPGWGSARRSVPEAQRASLASLLRTLGATLALAMLVAALDVALLMLARAATRRPEVAMRRVLGAPRRRLARLLLVEGGLLGAAGALAGAAAGGVGVLLLRAGWPSSLTPWLDAPLPLSVVAAAVLVPLAVALSGSLLPLVPPRGRSLHAQTSGGARVTAGPGEGALRRRLSMLAVAGSVVLLTGSGLLLRGFGPLGAAGGPGPDPTDTLTLHLDLPAGATTPEERARYQEAVLARVAAIPGVEAGSLGSPGSWVGLGTQDLVHALGGQPMRPGVVRPARYHAVSPGYFAGLGLRVVRGREFTPADRLGAAPVALVSESFAHRLLPGPDPLGKRVQLGGMSLRGTFYTVVGVVEDVRVPGLGTGSLPVPALYLPALQLPPAAMGLAVRATGDPMSRLPAVERAIRAVDPTFRPLDAMTMEERLARHRAPLRWLALVFGAVAALATLLAASGLYGVVSYNVAQRTREIGVRLALGAPPRAVTAMVVREGMRLAAVGAVAGVAGALCLGRLLQFLFHGVEPLDPVVHAAVLSLLVGVALAASYRPARAAARVDPIVSLHAE